MSGFCKKRNDLGDKKGAQNNKNRSKMIETVHVQ